MTVKSAGSVRKSLVTAAVAVAMATTAFTPTAMARTEDQAPPGHAATQAALEGHVSELKLPGALGQARDENGAWNGSAGVADRETGRKRSPEDRFRVGSVSKVFTSVVLLQLEAEGRLSLDDTVEKWLPGVVRGNGNDGSKITVRQLLNHTSGLFNYTDDKDFYRQIHEDYPEHRFQSQTPAELIAVALRHEPEFAPGTGWHYSNTNYILAGMIVEKVTGHRYADEIQQRIIKPLGLRGTSLPGNATNMPDPHGRAYTTLYPRNPQPDDKVHDVTEQNASWLWAAGEIISTTGDLNTFYQALLGGRLLPAAQQKELLTTVQVGKEPGETTRYGLGLYDYKLPSCDVRLWTHEGDIHGSKTMAASTDGGRHTAAFNLNGDWDYDFDGLAGAEFCPKVSGGGADR
ncbi:beta-lactamase family protein [Streptomyces sp. AV19]|uniref:serine hydrolase domain-containing protein n=1 Tax=Streptomyces sp. AV19 TaxID=2793068 RepID=UPI0018FE4DC4|nr:serine hydrolase domain-containing protein [Streptomyces sp. AV19]MBH1934084.1 beta-lactamase family protein [Streptomyces sp. AV19]MDG4535435.1 beta-lactamase family protein [Streptomyces sp. AV19]